ncbi:SigB/SigF/SigG family RNA polymerase sigma factor [Streptomyces sp. NBC_00347]|uniref:SigB/SigF/SigG family RNA polymerase sigma factor n=1 Tax=Streptomyces sp. NBC_00347 TaxID=2975721 RepID=UPI00224D8752|nr:SigB/SigF/SigG family RNA polymerase sigma factor [Streptomyces sp. NBC_00347]MCX5129721.1 SigB/SigF/SigG family RNA polymerase sigma factor [Streptomyces sp. NBC_00347]
MSPIARDTAEPLHTALLPDLLGLPEDLVGVSTTDARTLSVELFRRLGTLEEGTPEFSYVRNTLVELNLSLVKYAARRYRTRREPLEDIIQVGTIGLIKAINRYDVERGVEFATFAIPTITGEIKRFFRDTSWSVKVPRRLQELRLDIAKAYDALEQRLGRRPSDHELAQRLGITDTELAEGLQAANGYTAGSLDAPLGEDTDASTLTASLGAEEAAYDLIECLETLKPLLTTLSDRDRRILDLRFGEELTQSEIGDRLGLSQMHVSRLLNRITERLRTGLLTDDRVADEGVADDSGTGTGTGTGKGSP